MTQDQTPSNQNQAFAAIVLAGDRNAQDPLREHAGASCKALMKIGGVPMLHSVLGTLRNASSIGTIRLSGPQLADKDSDPLIKGWVDAGEIDWQAPEATPSTSAYNSMQQIDPATPVLLTTADHPLLKVEMVEFFCRYSRDKAADVTIGLAPYALVKQAHPKMKKTVLQFRDGEYCGCNLFSFMTADGRKVADFWRQIESERKKPLRVIRLLGWWPLVRYRLGLLTLDEAMLLLSRRLGLKMRAVVMPFADAAVDVDSVSDYSLVEGYVTGMKPAN